MKYFANAKCEIKFALSYAVRHISYCVAIFHTRSVFHLPQANFIEKSIDIVDAFFWWGGVDSNHRSNKQQIYSLSPLATREPPLI